MNAVFEPTQLDSLIGQATPEQCRQVLERLLTRIAIDGTAKPFLCNGMNGDMLGVFIPLDVDKPSAPMSPEAYAALRETIANTKESDLLTHEQLIAELGLEGADRSNRQ